MIKKAKKEGVIKNVTINKNKSCGGNSGGAIYGLGIIGAAFYFLQGATSFGAVLMGLGKAIFWPAVLMFELLKLLQL